MTVTLLLTIACAQDVDTAATTEVTGADFAVTATELPTVFRVSWTTDAASVGTVRYGVGTLDHTLTADTVDGRTHTALLAGLGAGETWTIQAVADDGAWESPTTTVVLAAPEADLPGILLAGGSDTDAEGFYLLASSGNGNETRASVAIVDHAGRPTWWAYGESGAIISDAWLVDDAVWWMSFGATGYLARQRLDGSDPLQVDNPLLSHSFTPMPDGGFVADAYDDRLVGDLMVKGDQLLRYDADGNELGTLWSTWDVVSPPEDLEGESDPFLWTHVNAVRYDATHDELVVTCLGLDTVFGVDATTGETRWTFGGESSDIDLSAIAEDHVPHGIHGAVRTEAGVMLFNNRIAAAEQGDYWSEAVEYAVDWEAGTATVAWTFDAEQEVFAPAMGNAEDWPDGRRMVSFGVAGRVVELDADGAVQWSLDTSLGTGTGYVHPLVDVAGATR